jgi:hypothetical protein
MSWLPAELIILRRRSGSRTGQHISGETTASMRAEFSCWHSLARSQTTSLVDRLIPRVSWQLSSRVLLEMAALVMDELCAQD